MKTEFDFYQKADAIAHNSRRLETDTIFSIAEALEKEFKATFKKRFRKMDFLKKAGLV